MKNVIRGSGVVSFGLFLGAAIPARAALNAPHDRGIPPPPPPTVVAMFERIDLNHDGMIDVHEFEAAHLHPGQPAGMPGDHRHPAPAHARGRMNRPGPMFSMEPGEPAPDSDHPQRGPKHGASEGRDPAPSAELRRMIREAVDEALRAHEPKLRDLVRDAVREALNAPRPEGGDHGDRPPLGGPRRPGGDERGHRRERGNPAEEGGAGGGDRMMSGENMSRRFDEMDANHDGFVTADEFKGPQRRFERIDANGDGRLDKEEMAKAIRRFMERGQRGEGREKPKSPPSI